MATLDRSIQQIRKTAAQLYADNATLASGQLAIESDTKKGKIGPGAFRDLPYADFNVRAADADYANDQRDGEGGGGGGGQLTADELAAINGAASPSASNVFATAEDLATKEDLFVQFFQATIDGVLHNFKPNFIIGGKVSWVADEDATAVFFYDNSGPGFWKLDIGPSGVAVASDTADEADPTAVPSWDLTGITLVVGPQVYGSTSQEALEQVAEAVAKASKPVRSFLNSTHVSYDGTLVFQAVIATGTTAVNVTSIIPGITACLFLGGYSREGVQCFAIPNLMDPIQIEVNFFDTAGDLLGDGSEVAIIIAYKL